MGLDVFVGEWTIHPDFPGLPPVEGHGRMTFEWMAGEHFLIQRWELPVPEAPDGLAVIGFDDGRDTYLQHYFDTRGVARVYEMSIENGVWTLRREQPDFSPFEFAQRYTGRFSDDGDTITGAWEIRHDGTTWEKDFDLVYRKVR